MIHDDRSRFARALDQAPAFDGPLARRPPAHAPLPPSFGRLTTILSASPHLDSTLRRLERMCQVSRSEPSLLGAELHPTSLLEDLSGQLALRFAAEEAEGHYGVIIDEEPSLLSTVSALEREHAAMLEAVETLLDMSADRTRWREVVLRTERLLEEFQSHEHGEQQLLQQLFFGRDEGASSPSETYTRVRLRDGKSPLLVLVVDDERVVRVVVRRVLEEAGCVVVEAEDAMAALRVLEERGSAVGAIVSDVGLPGMLGSELVRVARTSCPGIATLLMSGDARSDLVAAGRVGADTEVLEKPFLPEDMIARLRAALERRG